MNFYASDTIWHYKNTNKLHVNNNDDKLRDADVTINENQLQISQMFYHHT